MSVFGNNWIRPEVLEKELGMSRARQAHLRSQGKLSYHKVGSYVYYSVEYINQLIEDGKVS